MQNIWNWIKDRFKSPRSKTDLLTFVGILAAIGLIAGDVVDQIREIIEAGQGLYGDGTSLFELIKVSAQVFWGSILGFVSLIGNLLSSRKREQILSSHLRQNSVDPNRVIADFHRVS